MLRSKSDNRQCNSCRYYTDRVHGLEKLLLDTPETYYWIGFLLADGHFSDTTGVCLSLAEKDLEHLQKFKEYIGASKKLDWQRGMVRCIAANKPVVENIMKKFNIDGRKTYNPPHIEIFDGVKLDLILSLIAGYIDGDGSIYKNTSSTFDSIVSLRIKCHSSWIPFLDCIKNYLGKSVTVKINNRGYALLNHSNTYELQKFKQQLLKLNLPLLNRKWDRINLAYVTTHEIAEMNYNKACKLFQLGLTITEAASKLDVSYKCSWKYYQKYKTQQ